MKIAIIQEWLVTVGGSDKVVKAIASGNTSAIALTTLSEPPTVTNHS